MQIENVAKDRARWKLARDLTLPPPPQSPSSEVMRLGSHFFYEKHSVGDC